MKKENTVKIWFSFHFGRCVKIRIRCINFYIEEKKKRKLLGLSFPLLSLQNRNVFILHVYIRGILYRAANFCIYNDL